MNQSVLQMLLVGLGGMGGAMARYGVSLLARPWSVTVPCGTLLVNVGGSLAIGVLAALSAGPGRLAPELRLLLATGFCGGFTTMSTLTFETAQLLHDREYYIAAVYLGASVLGSLVAFFLSFAAVRALTKG